MIVVISQSAANQPKLRDYEEQLVTHLLLEARCEVNLVPDLATLEPENTGLLCLEGIRGSMVLLSWHAAADAHGFLRKHGIYGQLLAHDDATSSPSPEPQENLGPGIYDAMQRTIHHLKLNLQHTLEYYTLHICKIEGDTKIQTVALGIPGSIPPATGPRETPAKIPGNPTVAAAESPALAELSTQPTPDTVKPVPKRSDRPIETDGNDPGLDELIDQLDDFGL